jgi:3-oxoacyl-[acyl-carrier protein] reductase
MLCFEGTSQEPRPHLTWAFADGSCRGKVVNNAGRERVCTLGSVSAADYDAVFDVNVRGVLLLTQAALPHLRAPARIVNLSSVGAPRAFTGLGLYCASKAALEGLTRCWAAELGADGTTVNCVDPGPVMTELLEKIPEEHVARQRAETPIGRRLGTIEEIADVVAMLVGREGAWITGQCISASGVSRPSFLENALFFTITTFPRFSYRCHRALLT